MKPPSVIWKYFSDSHQDESGNAISDCIFCKKSVKYNNNMSNLYYHLRARHFPEYEAIIRKRDVNIEAYKGKLTNPVWEYFVDIPANITGSKRTKHKPVVACKICDKKLMKNATSLIYHLTRIHQIELVKNPVKGNNNTPETISDLPVEESLKTSLEEVDEKPPILAEVEPAFLPAEPALLPAEPPLLPVEPSLLPVEPVEEPYIIFDDDQDDDTNEHSLMTPDASRESSPLLTQLLETPCKELRMNEADDESTVENSQLPVTSTPVVDSSKACNSYQKGAEDTDLNATLSDIRANLEDLKSKIFNSSDLFFFKSVSEEFHHMNEEAKDVVKAGLWQIIFKVKAAIRNNEKLSLSNLAM